MFPGQQGLEDDLRDHWTSPPHKAERLRLIHRLLAASAKGIRITLLSGDVHVAAIGVIESDRSNAAASSRVVNQLTSSGIVHPAPPGVALFFLERACQAVEQIDRGITGTMFEFPTTSHRMIGCRNFSNPAARWARQPRRPLLGQLVGRRRAASVYQGDSSGELTPL